MKWSMRGIESEKFTCTPNIKEILIFGMFTLTSTQIFVFSNAVLGIQIHFVISHAQSVDEIASRCDVTDYYADSGVADVACQQVCVLLHAIDIVGSCASTRSGYVAIASIE